MGKMLPFFGCEIYLGIYKRLQRLAVNAYLTFYVNFYFFSLFRILLLEALGKLSYKIGLGGDRPLLFRGQILAFINKNCVLRSFINHIKSRPSGFRP